MEDTVIKLAIIGFFVTGMSHILQPRVWARFFIHLRSMEEVGSFLNALLHFPLGVVIVSFHNVWHGLPLILTLIGWGLVIKSSFYFFFPRFGMKILERVSLEKSWGFVVAGLFSVGISGFLMFLLFRN